MKIETTTVRKLRISDINNLDPISIYLEDYDLGQGKITITCFDGCWTNYWGAMGQRTITQFFIDADQHYLAGKLSNIDSRIYDEDKMRAYMKTEIIKARKAGDFSKKLARTSWEEVDGMNVEYHYLVLETEILERVLGDDWYHHLPKTTNPDYQYLCHVINAVKEALKVKNDNN